ncbi:MAG: ATP-dependent DNA helicase RecG, partial [Deltaproteobacteria bacterium]|nr:ATP-dependent DNA helicase RecG [Deltaproteobacteria bacterium]
SQGKKKTPPGTRLAMAFLTATDPATIKLLRAGIVGLSYRAQRLGHAVAKSLGLIQQTVKHPPATLGRPDVKTQIIHFLAKPLPAGVPSKTSRALLDIEDDALIPVIRNPQKAGGLGDEDRDAVFYFPRDYQDRSTLRPISSLKHDETALVRGKVVSHNYVPIRRLKRPMLEARITDGTGTLSIKWFAYNRAHMEGKLRERATLVAYGTVKEFGGRPGMTHPDIEWDVEEGEAVTSEKILPLYSETEGLTQKVIRRIVMQAVEACASTVVDELPAPVRAAHGLVPITQALRALHEPAKGASVAALRAFNTPEQKRLIFDELFKFEWVVGRRRLNMRREHTKAYPKEPAIALVEQLRKKLPFELTDDQNNAIDRIFDDLAVDKPMNRLLQGDVGCGKTLVALATSLPVVASGGQVAIMAPTEILAEQHLVSARKTIDGLLLPTGRLLTVDLLTGSTTKARRDEILGRLASGETQILIGTHALIEDPVKFAELGLIVVDEQHRFGVDQRMKLRAKGRHPHVLSLTATPIPRTLALTAYGDLDISIIRQMPKGRPEVYTSITKEHERAAMLDMIRRELKKGRQAYVIYPLVEESEKIDLANAVTGAEELANGPLAGFRVGLLHGRMKSQEKADVMASFKRGEVQALVSTTVIEVGVDVPNATVLVVEHADRFGLSQLHQLRGRIGRGTETSYCYLIAGESSGQQSYDRLKAMERTRDGFQLAELDLEIRGPGEFLGTRQSGELQFQYASLVRDQFILHESRKAAFDILKTDPELERPEHAPLRTYMQRTGHLAAARFQTA